MTFPRPRNALDASLSPWRNWSYPADPIHFDYNGNDTAGSCPKSTHDGAAADLVSNGQACYWFSNGCTPGCAACDGTTSHVGHGTQAWLYKGMSRDQVIQHNITVPWTPAPGDLVLDRHAAGTKALRISAGCAAPTSLPTVCDPRLRSINTQAACGGPDDYYLWSPWRAPGAAPVIDACGSAGGRHAGQGPGGAAANFQNSSVATLGDRGSALPAMPAQASWAAGGAYEAGWTVMANHGGGYAYRLCPAGEPLTEACFRRTPLDFVGNSALRWGGDVATQLEFNASDRGWETTAGTTPAGSMWRKNPVPATLWSREGANFEPVCEESAACQAALSAGSGAAGVCKCSGWSNGGPLLPNLEIVDRLRVPASLAPGDYVLQWRWDCEESDQIWASCSDITVTAAAAAEA